MPARARGVGTGRCCRVAAGRCRGWVRIRVEARRRPAVGGAGGVSFSRSAPVALAVVVSAARLFGDPSGAGGVPPGLAPGFPVGPRHRVRDGTAPGEPVPNGTGDGDPTAASRTTRSAAAGRGTGIGQQHLPDELQQGRRPAVVGRARPDSGGGLDEHVGRVVGGPGGDPGQAEQRDGPEREHVRSGRDRALLQPLAANHLWGDIPAVGGHPVIPGAHNGVAGQRAQVRAPALVEEHRAGAHAAMPGSRLMNRSERAGQWDQHGQGLGRTERAPPPHQVHQPPTARPR